MKTIITKNIEGHEVIIGFSEAVIDPVETNKNIESVLKTTDEIKNFEKKIKEIQVRNKNIVETVKIIKGFNYIKDNPLSSDVDKKNAIDKIEVEQGNLKNQYNQKLTLESELKLLHKDVILKQKNIFTENCVYFETKTGEAVISDSEYVTLKDKFDTCSYRYALKRDGTEIADFRGVEYYIKNGTWEKITIEALGEVVPGNGFTFDVLTDMQKIEIQTQFEADRITALSVADKDAEKSSVIESLALQAATMRNKLEIQGVDSATALSDSQTWYNAEVALVEIKYA